MYISGPDGEFYWWPAVQKAKATEFCAVAPDVGGTCCFVSLCWILECLGCCQIFGNCMHPCCWQWDYWLQIRCGVFIWGPAVSEYKVCTGSLSTCYEVRLCFVKWANDVGWEHHFVIIKCCYFHCATNTAMWISCSWSIYDTVHVSAVYVGHHRVGHWFTERLRGERPLLRTANVKLLCNYIIVILKTER